MHHSLTIMRFTIHQSFNHTRVHSRSRSHQPRHVCTTNVYGQALAVMESSQCLVCGDHYKWWDAHDSNPSAGKVGYIAWVSVPPPPRATTIRALSTNQPPPIAQPPARPPNQPHLLHVPPLFVPSRRGSHPPTRVGSTIFSSTIIFITTRPSPSWRCVCVARRVRRGRRQKRGGRGRRRGREVAHSCRRVEQ